MKSEAAIQQQIRLAASEQGIRLYRNNVGVMKQPAPECKNCPYNTGMPVRYGLANESKKLNSEIKSADLIGITPMVITQEMVGMTFGRFTSYEVKKEGWVYNHTTKERAQWNWMTLVNSMGGYAKFTTGEL